MLKAEHSDKLRNMADLACVFFLLDRRGEVILLKSRIIGLRSKTIGEDHPDTLDPIEWFDSSRLFSNT